MEKAYKRQRNNANRRGIPWDISFEDWQKVWLDSGMWEQRGVGRDRACMSRIDDEGAYALGNVAIKLQWENRKEYLDCRWAKPNLDPFRPYERTSAWDYPKKA